MIPRSAIEIGIGLCYKNAARLLSAANAILKEYVTPYPIDPNYIRDIKYSSCCGLVVLAIEEIGKGYFLLQKYQANQNISDKEWEDFKSRWKAHIRKIKETQKLLGLNYPTLAQVLNKIKQRDIYVDWDNKKGWQSPLDFLPSSQQPTDLLNLGQTALRELERQCEKEGIYPAL